MCIGFIGIWRLSDILENNRPKLSTELEDAELTFKSDVLAKYSLGFNGLLADWYWITSLQYLGKKAVANKGKFQMDNLTKLNPKQLYPLLESATNLDPKFVNVYAYGAIVLPSIDVEKAISFAEKGIVHNPNEWRLYQYLGYIYWKKGDFKKAAEIYKKGSEIEGVPPFMKLMAARVEGEGGSRDMARQIYTQMFDEATDDATKSLAAGRLLQVESFEEREAINSALKDLLDKNQPCAKDWREIYSILKTIKLPPNNRLLTFDSNASPLDPSGIPYIIETIKCEANLDYQSTKILLN
jgi:tetratricopeptide (TPR) repeat protein